ncbi:transcriptional regulator domain-containing protein [Ferrovibrio sp.]|uniref:transcriptional regulator domain-containing protein n=1 Tax=Ferrovibrio sp. TaxID=1917215 RepID=UPI00311E3026
MAEQQSLVSAQRNWRDPSAYMMLRHVGREQLAWEFLRRNPKYQEMYVAEAAMPKKTVAGNAHVYQVNQVYPLEKARHWGLLFLC